MKPFNFLTLLLFVLFTTIFLPSCEKDKIPTCRLAELTDSDDGKITLTYNNDGLVTKMISNDGYEINITYSGNTITATTTEDGVFQGKQLITKNTANFVTNSKMEFNTLGTDFLATTYEYSGTELMKRTTTYSLEPLATLIENFTWSGGNLTKIAIPAGSVTDASITTFTQSLDKPFHKYDYLTFDYGNPTFFLLGVKEIVCKNQTKSVEYEGDITDILYQFDNENKPVKVTLDYGGGDSEFLAFLYNCD